MGDRVNYKKETDIRQLIPQMNAIETATFGHILDEGFMAPEIQSLFPQSRCFGPVVTVSLPDDNGYILPAALDEVKPGDVLVITCPDSDRHACWGEVMATAAKCYGIAGVIIDGFVTDLHALTNIGLPVWCKGRSPLTTKRRQKEGTINQPVVCGGIVVTPGDWILADENGVLCLAPDIFIGNLDEVTEIQCREPSLIERINKGERLSKIYQ